MVRVSRVPSNGLISPSHEEISCASKCSEQAAASAVALGAGRNGGIREAGTRSVVDAMRQSGVRRLVCQSTIGVGDSRGNLPLLWKYVMLGAVLRPAFQDHIKQVEVVRASGLDWTIVRPGAFVDGPAGGAYRHGFDGQTARPSSRSVGPTSRLSCWPR